jgi:hypothetical protein
MSYANSDVITAEKSFITLATGLGRPGQARLLRVQRPLLPPMFRAFRSRKSRLENPTETNLSAQIEGEGGPGYFRAGSPGRDLWNRDRQTTAGGSSGGWRGETRCKCYKTFFVRNLRMLVKS